MTDCFSFHAGHLPLLVSVPHDGRQLPEGVANQMTTAGRAMPDTDWHVARLYDFVTDFGASMIVASYSRYVVDLNRPSDDGEMYAGQLATGLCPTQTFAGADIYANPVSIDVAARVERFWRPYHDKVAATLKEISNAFGYALLFDAHSIPSRVPRLFTGELPVLNLGTWNGQSCSAAIADAIAADTQASGYSFARDARFKGGFITRHYGEPERNLHAIQLEIAQRAYMDEATLEFDDGKSARLRATLNKMLTTFLDTAKQGG